MKNELMIIESVDKRLQQKRSETVFPLSPTHRKELRELRNNNLGNLRTRLRLIRNEKLQDYKDKYAKEIAKTVETNLKTLNELNNEWDGIKKQLINSLRKHKEKFDKYNENKIIGVNTLGWGCDALKFLDRDNELEEIKRTYYFKDKLKYSEQIAKDEFDAKYKEAFNKVDKMIDAIQERYEEAINFGDLEIVKELYYSMKNSDKLFKQIENMKV